MISTFILGELYKINHHNINIISYEKFILNIYSRPSSLQGRHHLYMGKIWRKSIFVSDAMKIQIERNKNFIATRIKLVIQQVGSFNQAVGPLCRQTWFDGAFNVESFRSEAFVRVEVLSFSRSLVWSLAGKQEWVKGFLSP